ncbi:MAG: hypothetical protein ACP6IS_06960 [Candidatus Asgardarchaeia archaeon]
MKFAINGYIFVIEGQHLYIYYGNENNLVRKFEIYGMSKEQITLFIRSWLVGHGVKIDYNTLYQKIWTQSIRIEKVEDRKKPKSIEIVEEVEKEATRLKTKKLEKIKELKIDFDEKIIEKINKILTPRIVITVAIFDTNIERALELFGSNTGKLATMTVGIDFNVLDVYPVRGTSKSIRILTKIVSLKALKGKESQEISTAKGFLVFFDVLNRNTIPFLEEILEMARKSKDLLYTVLVQASPQTEENMNILIERQQHNILKTAREYAWALNKKVKYLRVREFDLGTIEIIFKQLLEGILIQL